MIPKMHLPNYSPADLGRMLLIAVLYSLLVKVNFSYIYPNGEASVIWLPSGFGLAILLIYGKRYWPAILLGILAGYTVILGRPFLPSATVGLFSNALEPLAVIWLLSGKLNRDRQFNPVLNDPADLIALSSAAVIASCFAALSGCTLLTLFGIYQPSNFTTDTLHWWMGNLLGILLITPLILTWRTIPPCWLKSMQCKLEMLAFLVLAFISGQILFMDWLHAFFGDIAGSYWMFIFVCWGALRFGLHGTLLVISMVAIQSVIGASHGLGIFGGDSYAANLVNTWFYLITLSLVGMLLSSVIQKRRESEAQLADNEKRWKYALEGSGDAVWDWNAQTNEVIFSRNWTAMLGYGEEDVGRHLSDWENLIHPEDKVTVFAELHSYMNGYMPSYISEYRMQCKDGSWKWILDRGLAFSHTADGKPLRMVGTHTDISRHKQLEDALKQNEEDLYTLFAQSPDGIVVFDDSDTVSHVNAAFSRISGLSYYTLIGISETAFDALMQTLCRDGTQYPATANLRRQGELSPAITPDTQPRRRTADHAQQFEILTPGQRVLSRSLIDLDQQRLSRVMYFRDITAETLIDRMKSDFLSTAAHELRTPMSIILGYAELLKQHSFSKEEEIKMVDCILEQSHSIVVLLNELLDLARIEARAGKAFNMKSTPIAPLIDSLAETFMLAGDARKVKLLPLPALPELNVDKDKITQALKNCLSNAFKFSPLDSEVSMEVAVIQKDNMPLVAIAVKDHGIGMNAQQLSRIFEKFYRADTSGKIPGTGLGMTLMKEIMEHHGGKVLVESEIGKGTVVTLTLPIPPNKEDGSL